MCNVGWGSVGVEYYPWAPWILAKVGWDNVGVGYYPWVPFMRHEASSFMRHAASL